MPLVAGRFNAWNFFKKKNWLFFLSRVKKIQHISQSILPDQKRFLVWPGSDFWTVLPVPRCWQFLPRSCPVQWGWLSRVEPVPCGHPGHSPGSATQELSKGPTSKATSASSVGKGVMGRALCSGVEWIPANSQAPKIHRWWRRLLRSRQLTQNS